MMWGDQYVATFCIFSLLFSRFVPQSMLSFAVSHACTPSTTHHSGYQLGDNDQWAKHTNFEHAPSIPLIARVPAKSVGSPDALVESVDVLSLLVEAATGIQLAHCPESQTDSRNTERACTEGFSLLPLILAMQEDQAQAERESVCPHSVHAPVRRERRGRLPNGLHNMVMGYTQRMNDWRYTEWVLFNYSNANPQTNLGPGVWTRTLRPPRCSSARQLQHGTHQCCQRSCNKDLVDQMHERLVKCVEPGRISARERTSTFKHRQVVRPTHLVAGRS